MIIAKFFEDLHAKICLICLVEKDYIVNLIIMSLPWLRRHLINEMRTEDNIYTGDEGLVIITCINLKVINLLQK